MSNEEDDFAENFERDLCSTPLVDQVYLKEFRERVDKFNQEQRTRSFGESSRQLEALKDAAIKQRQERAKRVKSVAMTHIFEMVAYHFDIPYQEVLDGVLDAETHVELLAALLVPDGRAAILFVYTLLPPPPIESGRTLLESIKRLIVTDGTEVALENVAILAYRVNKLKTITSDNVCDEIMFSRINGGEIDIVAAVADSLHLPLVEPLFHTNDWGELVKHPSGDEIRKKFLGNVAAFQEFLTNTSKDLSGRLKFDIPFSILNDLRCLPYPAETVKRNDLQLFSNVEQVVKTWYKKIEHVLEEADSVRAESANAEPRAELDFWRSWLTKFNTILDFLQSEPAVLFLKAATPSRKPYVLKWQALCDRVENACNEAKDNVKYLEKLIELSQKLSVSKPNDLPKHLRTMLFSIRITFASSHYFNTTERATALLVKVTNQVVSNFRNYLTDAGTLSIWKYPKKEVIEKIQICLNVFESYKTAFAETDQSMAENPKEKPFGCSQANVFTRLLSFCERIKKIQIALQSYTEISILHNSCLRGVDDITVRLDQLLKDLVTHPCDPLDDRRTFFDDAYQIFTTGIELLKKDVQKFCSDNVAQCPDVSTALKMLDRFAELNLSFLCLEKEYMNQFILFKKEIERVRDRYNQDREGNPVPVSLSPIAGRIAWIRHLYRKIEEPMNKFKKIIRVIKHPLAQPVIRQYNCLCKVFMHYEMLHHDAWKSQIIPKVDFMMKMPILKRERSILTVNWPPYLDETVREVESMWKMNLSIPDEAGAIPIGYQDLIVKRDQLSQLTKRYNLLRRSLPYVYIPLMKTQLYNLDVSLDPGHVNICWLSLEIQSFCDTASKAISDLEFFIGELKDLHKFRIQRPMDEIAEKMLFQLDLPAPVSVSEYLATNAMAWENFTKLFDSNIQTAENAAIELVNRFVYEFDVRSAARTKYLWLKVEYLLHGETIDYGPVSEQEAFNRFSKPNEADLVDFQNDCMQLYSGMFKQVVDTLVATTSRSLTNLQTKITTDDGKNYLITADIVLNVPNVLLVPSLEQIQNSIMEMIRNCLLLFANLTMWGNQANLKDDEKETDTKLKPDLTTDFSKIISENKDIVILIGNMQGAITSDDHDVERFLKLYQDYSYLWESDIVNEVKTFLETQPSFFVIEDKMKLYAGYRKSVEALPDVHHVDCLRINTGLVKAGLVENACKWTEELGKQLVTIFTNRMTYVQDHVKKFDKILLRHIIDLDDVQIAMACLAEVRDKFIDLTNYIKKIEDVFGLLVNQKLPVPADTLKSVDILRHDFNSMNTLSRQVQLQLFEIQEPLKKDLLQRIEVFKEDEENFQKYFQESGPTIPGLAAKEASDRVIIVMMKLDTLFERWEKLSEGERLFGLKVTDFPNLTDRKKQMLVLNRLYSLYESVMKSIKIYLSTLWTEIDIEVITNELIDYQTRCKKLPKSLMEFPVYGELVSDVDELKEVCPLLELLAHSAVKERHWIRLIELTSYNFPYESPTFCLRDVVQAPLLFHKEGVEDICIGAQKELEVEAKLKNVIAEWQSVYLSFSSFKNRGELLLKGQETKDILAQLEDSLMIVSSLSTNRYNLPFKKDIQIWLKKLVKTSETLETWLLVQNLWLYLEAVFVSGDIAKKLAQESKRFLNIDKSWVRLMARAQDVKVAVEIAADEATSQLLTFMLEALEACQKGLTVYLETLRCAFPRFFFVSDPTLLEILGQASDSHTIQNYLLNIFENVFLVEFDEKIYDRITGMFSREMEYVKFDDPVACIGSVEQWLASLLKTAHYSLGSVISDAASMLTEPGFKILDLIAKYPAQVGLLAIQFLWTRDSETALWKSRTDRRIMKDTNGNFLSLLNLLIEQTTRDLTKVERTKYETLVTIHVHQRDIFDEITRKRIRSPMDFEWLKNMRFYYSEKTEETVVKVTDVSFVYQNEFMGCTERLVITPLTDRCYITLAQAIGMSMGGAPAGPAGTGKTETTKDMAKALGKYCVVFNCSDQMDFRGLGRIFKGLAQSGSWGCFDEFNRIDLPVLSVAAQQISIVLAARKQRKPSFTFSDGDNVPLNMEFGIFITMNPGYAGRQELPENLKMMFRPIAMMVPDRQIIMRVKLASCGFKENVQLARKFFTLYQLCEEQLSKQVHYDFGLRNILSVLRTLGAQKRANPNDSEETTVMSVLRYMNVSKLVDEDEPLFTALVGDLFPGSRIKGSTQRDLQKFIVEACSELALINHPAWNLKIIQLYETSLVRHGLMLLGPTGSGKTTCARTLMLALTLNGIPHHELRLNPKAITAPQMFGRLDVATNDWTDGIFSTLWRRTHKIPETECTWLILDGPVDAVWIENLNSVLDDNKTLTLANGDRITMAPNSKLLFEPDNVANASPATVSRMGMVFLSASVMPSTTILKGWLLKRPQYVSLVLEPLFEAIYSDLQTFVSTKLLKVMHVADVIYIRQCCEILDGLVRDIKDTSDLTNIHWERLFIFGLMWSLGALLELSERDKMERFLRSHPSKLNWPENKGSMFEYFVDEVGNWQHWSSRVEEYLYPDDSIPNYLSILVPNIDNVRTAYLIKAIAEQGKAVLLTGEQGTAKTVMMRAHLQELDPETHLHKIYNFSSVTQPNMVQRVIESYVEKRAGFKFGPPGGRKMTIFIDDLSMPLVNEWGDQITNELTRQLMEMGGFYSLDKPGEFATMADIQLVAAMIHPGGGRNDIPSRLKRHFAIFNCTLPSDSSIDKIFAVIAQGYFCSTRFSPEIVEMAPLLVPLTRTVWQIAKNTMLPTPSKFHYVFNLRDLSRIWQGILTVTNQGCDSEGVFLELWRHECQRIISDRFVSQEEQEWFKNKLDETAKLELASFARFLSKEDKYFCDFLQDAPEPTGDEPDDFSLDPPKIYELVPSWDIVKDKLREYMASYNESIRGSKLDLVFFLDAMRHLVIISRTIRTQRGSMMLVGVGGSGKQSLTKLASHIAGYKTFQIAITRSYNVSNFLEDLKALYRIAGQQGQGVTFLFTENDIKDETFLEYLNNVLSAGEVANLFTKEEIDEIANYLIPVMKKEFPRRNPSLDALYDYFLTRAQANLHVVLCFSPVGTKFRSRTQKFPGLISGCTIDWFQKWPQDALIAVSQHILQNFPIICTDRVKSDLISVMADAHTVTNNACSKYFERFRRLTHVTPKSFLSLLESYKTTYNAKLMNINTMNIRMKGGVEKLNETASAVNVLKIELEAKEKDIAIASAEANKVLAEVTKKATAMETVKTELESVKEGAEKLVAEIAQETFEANSKLLAAKPALLAAEVALQTINAKDIATVRKLGKPPYLITVIMDVVCILLRRKINPIVYDEERNFFTTSWNESLKVMADPRFLLKLQNFEKDKINEETIDLMKPYLQMPDYTVERAKLSSGSVAGLIQWTRAMADFYQVNRDVLPLKANLAILQKKLSIAEKELVDAQVLLEAKQSVLDEVQLIFNVAHEKQQAVLKDAMACKTKMDMASALINGLTGERARWAGMLAVFNVEKERLVGDAMILTAFLCYAGPFNQEYREMLVKSWVDNLEKNKIPFTGNLNITNTLVDPATVGEWNVFGLPSDELSVQNGILVRRAPRYPLLIDPQTQGKNWIKNMEKYFQLTVTNLNDRFFRIRLEDAINLGRPLLIEDVEEELDPILDHVLEKNYIRIGTALKVKVGDKEIDIHPDFRLYITTKLPNPIFPPEISARTAVIDFTVTMKGLEEQLLGRVIVSEQNELEIERLNLIKGVTMNRREMQELEAGLLQKLSSVKGSLVEDEGLVKMLNVSKDTATDLRMKLEVAEKTEEKLNTAREVFRPVATRGSILYFLVTDMSMINCMYQTSLAQFLELFDYSLEQSEKHIASFKRINYIIDFLTFQVFRYQTRGLYVVDKFMFLLLIALKIDLERKSISFDDFQCLVKGGAALDLHNVELKKFAWISDSTWLNLIQLSTIRPFSHIIEKIGQSEKQWKNWFSKEAPEREQLPEPYQNIEIFKHLLLIRCWCPDRTYAAGRIYIQQTLGPRFVEPVILNMEAMVSESRPNTPLLCLLSPGSDPTPQIERLSKSKQGICRAVSMGQGQEVQARRLLERSMNEGGWVLLQNCHLGLDYMSELVLAITSAETIHSDFRLFLTTEVHSSFPISLLQISIKYTNEPPQGIKAGLVRTYADLTDDTLELCDASEYVPLLFTASFFHTLVQERRKFGPLGWNIPYEFNGSDWLASVTFVKQHLDGLDKKNKLSWNTLRYMIGEIQYGGRVTDEFDKRLLNTLTRHMFNETILEPDHELYPQYPVLKFKTITDYLNNLELFPDIDPPQAIGLHSNANITFQTNGIRNMMLNIMSIQPKQSGMLGGSTREQRVTESVKEMLGKLPSNYDVHETREKLIAMGILTPMVIFLRQEIDRMRVVLKTVKTSLKDLLLAIDGSIIMNEALSDAMDAIDDARVPVTWLRGSWSSTTLGFWFTELLERNLQFAQWLAKGRPVHFWMTGFFNPQGFLTAMRQEKTRANKDWALDSVVLNNTVLRQSKEELFKAPADGILVYGLFLEGAGWDKRFSKLVESQAKVISLPMPLIHIKAVNTLLLKTNPTAGCYECPVYKKPVRTDQTYITTLYLGSSCPVEHWIMRGVALLCDTK